MVGNVSTARQSFFLFPLGIARNAQLLLMDRKGLVALIVDCFMTELRKVRKLT